VESATSIIFLVVLFAVFYFMLIRPQKKRVEQHRSLVESLDVGDDVVTIGGMYGTIRSIGDDDLEIEVADGTVVRFLKTAVSRRVEEPVDETEPEPAEPASEEPSA
jgi:preprotein translocase subunit YajC